ncbi:uncharacterized protein BP01DRAFT_75047 [Aspergillus saccharolyticus JOP 1030-1]|uniref:Uncharacterized protein n=1 Tax=Aspergillus saccharolyticus JOP 1030-1 TaxID=1450539 RepID=A0A318ZQE1_9EURO|nr:hypothetical protein BP01DRAFT_75047 [Aspergillus saccharolyticus JOP 1030-1]PYH49267.1 hypothetical protein BP01DRAFT_75047 [Aspergillus saccharolyticus JOP 1030-1]
MPFFRKRREGSLAPSWLPESKDHKPSKTGSHPLRALLVGKKSKQPAANPRPRATPPALPNNSDNTNIEHPTTTASTQTPVSNTISFFDPKTQTSVSWHNIDPPTDLLVSLDEIVLVPEHPRSYAPEMIEHPSSRTSPPSPTAATLLPGYNDVSGSVIVDWNGYPHFLSPQEEHDRQLQLEQAVQERMLGLPRRTDFAWERPGHVRQQSQQTLPRYTPAGAKSGSRSSIQSASSGGSCRR